jgi:hypothetical protein
MAALTITGKPTGFYNRIYKGMAFLFVNKNTKWFMLPRWLVSTPIQLYGVGGLTNNANKMEFAFADDCRKGSKGTTDVA